MIFAHYGFDISRGTLAFWMICPGDPIIPLINLMDEIRAGYDILQIDETTVQILKEDGQMAQTKSRNVGLAWWSTGTSLHPVPLRSDTIVQSRLGSD